ncbi:hypothetical protein OHS33_37815 (plasmid) [Streptomyces sp. NBC_00536]|uniref:DUF6875 domain-containing protein n=1 Tax=Streptomyces sp. NBC_00536 TaxID=2975769 RepID=UPI002E80B484|nr:hypothetical protein [Streptomyces sp. NBC_00536]WUC84161.1 hypothetical protein OHS33_37815 [Streptomyces sp. NBC_00536]
MRGDDLIMSWTSGEVARGEVPAEHIGPLLQVLMWSREFLVSSHPELGRTGPVCPYTQPALRKDLFHLALPSEDCDDLASAVDSLRTRHAALSEALSPEDRELLTILLVLPGFDPTDSVELDELQRKAKDEFVAEGLMIGQFHPVCEEPGLYNESFRPLRSPLPLLAVRKLLVFDLPFLVGDDLHMDHYLQRFAPAIPSRIRDQLVSRVVAA